MGGGKESSLFLRCLCYVLHCIPCIYLSFFCFASHLSTFLSRSISVVSCLLRDTLHSTSSTQLYSTLRHSYPTVFAIPFCHSPLFHSLCRCSFTCLSSSHLSFTLLFYLDFPSPLLLLSVSQVDRTCLLSARGSRAR